MTKKEENVITTATKITLIRLVLVPVFIVISLIKFPYNFLTAGLLYSVIALTDWLDGYIARKTNTVSKIGKLLDPIADKAISIAGLICALLTDLMLFPIASIVCVTLFIVREIAVSGMRAGVLKKGYVLSADKFGKIKTIFINVSIPIMYLAKSLEIEFVYNDAVYLSIKYLAWALFVVGFGFAMFSGARYFYINRKIIKESFSKDEANEKSVSDKKDESDTD